MTTYIDRLCHFDQPIYLSAYDGNIRPFHEYLLDQCLPQPLAASSDEHMFIGEGDWMAYGLDPLHRGDSPRDKDAEHKDHEG